VASPQLIDHAEMKAKGADHFFPTGSNYYKPMKQDAQFPNYGSSGGGDLWTGSAQSPFSSDAQPERQPQVVHGQWRHQYVVKEDPTYKWYPQNEQQFHHQYGPKPSHSYVQAPPEPAREVTARGKWHWILDDDDSHADVKPTGHLPTPSPTIYEEVKFDDYRPATEPSPIIRDHPYSYEPSPTFASADELRHSSLASVGFGAPSEVPFTLDYNKAKDAYKGPVGTSKQRP
jgi:hypothetical protein